MNTRTKRSLQGRSLEIAGERTSAVARKARSTSSTRGDLCDAIRSSAMTDVPKKRARTKVTLASLVLDRFVGGMHFEHEGRVLLESYGNPGPQLVTLPQTEDEWAAGALSLEPIATAISRTCLLADGSVYALAPIGQGGRRLASVDLAAGTCREVPQPDDFPAELRELIAYRGSAIAIGAWPDRRNCGYDGVVLSTGERLALPRADAQRPAYEIQVYAFGGDTGAALVIADGAAYLWKHGSVEPIAMPFALRAFDFGQRDRAITLDDGRLLLCCGDAADTGRDATAYGSYTIRWFDTEGRTGVFDPSIEFAVVGWAGPDGAMVVHRPEGSTKHLFSVVWTREREVSDVPRTWARFRKFAHDVVYSRRARALVCLQLKKSGAQVTAIPWSAIEALPRRPLGSQ